MNEKLNGEGRALEELDTASETTQSDELFFVQHSSFSIHRYFLAWLATYPTRGFESHLDGEETEDEEMPR